MITFLKKCGYGVATKAMCVGSLAMLLVILQRVREDSHLKVLKRTNLRMMHCFGFSNGPGHTILGAAKQTIVILIYKLGNTFSATYFMLHTA